MALENIILCNGFKGFYGSMDYDEMSYKGTMDKSFKLTLILLIAFIESFILSKYLSLSFVGFSNIAVFIVGFCVIANIISVPVKTNISAPILSITLGVYLAFFARTFHGIFYGLVFEVISCTMIVLLSFVLLHKFEIFIKRNNNLSMMSLYFVSVVLMLVTSLIFEIFHINIVRYEGSSRVFLFMDMVIMLLMSYTLVDNNKFIELGVNRKFPSYMEWYGASGIILSVVWIYPELVEMSIRRDLIFHRGKVFDSVDDKGNNQAGPQDRKNMDKRDVIDDYIENSKYKVLFKTIGVIAIIIFLSMNYLKLVEDYNEKRESQKDIIRLLEKEHFGNHNENSINSVEID
ncbi:MAG: Bax inhibitor-1/YccA family protein [Firmicutes bacterium]|jgi:uncharacterized YccA/Bax inhibitor family protein|nr:Bax inhibitor-1/YccA family protein [Bacillota bacterium]